MRTTLFCRPKSVVEVWQKWGVFFGMGVIFATLAGCKQVEYVVVRDSSEAVHSNQERGRDSIIVERNTIIREVDSAALAQYGITMADNQRAFLVLQNELMQRISQLEQVKRDSIVKTKEVPVPYPVVKEVEKELTKWQKFKMKGFWWLAVGLAGYVLWRTRKWWWKIITR